MNHDHWKGDEETHSNVGVRTKFKKIKTLKYYILIQYAYFTLHSVFNTFENKLLYIYKYININVVFYL